MFRRIAVLSLISVLAACHADEAVAPRSVTGGHGGGVASSMAIYGVLQTSDDLKPLLLRESSLIPLQTAEDVSALIGKEVKVVGHFVGDGSFMVVSIGEGRPDEQERVEMASRSKP